MAIRKGVAIFQSEKGRAAWQPPLRGEACKIQKGKEGLRIRRGGAKPRSCGTKDRKKFRQKKGKKGRRTRADEKRKKRGMPLYTKEKGEARKKKAIRVIPEKKKGRR